MLDREQAVIPAAAFEGRRQYAFERAAIDRSTRLPVLAFFGSAVFWLLLGTVAALISSIKLHNPDFLADIPWLTFGRIRPAHLNSMIYGWASMAGIGVTVWLMARLCRTELRHPWLLVAAAGLWNVGVLVGTLGILAGQSEGIEWLEMPRYTPPILAAALAVVVVWGLAMFRERRERHVYVTQWYLYGALFWFPWLYTVVTLLTIYQPVRGVVQASTNWWFAHNVLGLWLTPIGVGAAYYLIPKVIGRPIHSYYLSIMGFWALALFYNWLGIHHLIGGPLPAWLVTASVVGSVMMVIPVGAVAINHHLTMVGYFHLLRYSPTLRFVVFGAMNYTIVSVQGTIEALRSVNEVTHFTHYTVGHAHWGVYAFYTMIMFGAMYYIVPRLTGWEWASARLIKVHFWCTAVGVLAYVIALSVGGWFQGLWLNDPTIPFISVVRWTIPYLQVRSWAGGLIAVGHVAFGTLFVMNILHYGKRRRGPTLLAERPEAAEPAAAS
jgi:cytochrome c oxidase cbb3-type subunit 1